MKHLFSRVFDAEEPISEHCPTMDMKEFHLKVIEMLIKMNRPISEINDYVMEKKLDNIPKEKDLKPPSVNYIYWECPFCQTKNRTVNKGQCLKFDLGGFIIGDQKMIEGFDSCDNLDCLFNKGNPLKGRKIK